MAYLVCRSPTRFEVHLREGNAWAVSPNLRSEEQEAMWQVGVGMLMTLYRRAIDEGIFVEDDTEVMARTMIAMHQVRLAGWIERGLPRDTGELIRIMQQQLIRSFCRPELIDGLISEHLGQPSQQTREDDG